MSILLPKRARSWLFKLLRALFRLLPLSAGGRDKWRNRFVKRFPTIRPDTHKPRTGNTSTGVAPRALSCSNGAAIGHVPYLSNELPDDLSPPARLIAFYLPQFHPIPENDAWWGTGFTEWRNVTRALPQFEGHVQPRQPTDLGFYDLRTPEVLRAQASLAREYGIEAFCSYFYWFAGRTLLESPLRNWLEHPDIDLKLCLCWANENWTRTWSGRGQDTLITQHHGPEDDLAFIAYIAPYLNDPRYLRVDGNPLLLVYRPGLLPNAAATIARWRAWCRDNGVGELHLAYVQSFERPDPSSLGFDAAVEFPPNLTTLPSVAARQTFFNPGYSGEILDWREMARACSDRVEPNYPLYPGVNPGWDNEPRRPGRGRTLLHASPRGYRDWLVRAIKRVQRRTPQQRLVFINAWNEWAEGAVLEPDARLGHAWLDATRQALRPARKPILSPVTVIHAWYPEVLAELLDALAATGLPWRVILTTSPEKETAVRAVARAYHFNYEIHQFENRGRDILPFLHIADHLLGEGVDVVLKLHTKRSLHRQDGDAWRTEIMERLASPERARAILNAFDLDNALGMVAPEGHTPRLSFYWGANAANVRRLAALMGIPAPDVDQARFVAGSMLWARLESLRPLLDAHLAPWMFEDESGQVDGTTAHALERLLIPIVQASRHTTRTAAAVAGEADPDPDATYRYAESE